jgi:glutathione S-transferase
MKLYYSPGACSLAPHIVAHELGIPLDLAKVDTKTQKVDGGDDYSAINPKGYVPTLQLDDGQLLTEGPVISQYLADRRPEAGLVPAPGTMERYRLLEILGFLNSEIHANCGPLFNPQLPAESRQDRIQRLQKRYKVVERELTGRDYLLGSAFTVADAYLFVLTTWATVLKIDLSPYPNTLAFQKRVAARPAVQAALRAEGLPWPPLAPASNRPASGQSAVSQ